MFPGRGRRRRQRRAVHRAQHVAVQRRVRLGRRRRASCVAPEEFCVSGKVACARGASEAAREDEAVAVPTRPPSTGRGGLKTADAREA